MKITHRTPHAHVRTYLCLRWDFNCGRMFNCRCAVQVGAIRSHSSGAQKSSAVSMAWHPYQALLAAGGQDGVTTVVGSYGVCMGLA